MNTAFPAKIGAVNDAFPDSSNMAIFNRTIDYCKNNEVDIAIIGWSEYTRVTFNKTDVHSYDRLGQFTFKPSGDPQKFFMYYETDLYLKQFTHNLIESLYYWLESNSIKPIFLNAFQMSPYKVQVPFLWDGNSWLKQFAIDNGLLAPKKIRHPNQDEHDWLAEELLSYINDLSK